MLRVGSPALPGLTTPGTFEVIPGGSQLPPGTFLNKAPEAGQRLAPGYWLVPVPIDESSALASSILYLLQCSRIPIALSN
jgi:hypothetical protein